MVNDPYQVLGVSKEATKDEIKKAYRVKAKQYHPDLHPNDPMASKKMNDVNEAYDMLMNPEKYEAKRTQHQSNHSQYSENYSSGQSRNSTESNSSGGYYGNADWYGGFGFEDIFGFGREERVSTNPTHEPSDSAKIYEVVELINNRQYQKALDILIYIPSTQRDARWFYLSSLANHGLKNTVQSIDHMQKAVQMDQNNRTYQTLLRQFRRAEQTYDNNARGFNMDTVNMQKLCMGCMIVQCLCGPCGQLRCV